MEKSSVRDIGWTPILGSQDVFNFLTLSEGTRQMKITNCFLVGMVALVATTATSAFAHEIESKTTVAAANVTAIDAARTVGTTNTKSIATTSSVEGKVDQVASLQNITAATPTATHDRDEKNDTPLSNLSESDYPSRDR